MQIVIELSDETYKDIKEENGIYGINNGLNARITGKVVGAIQSGTPLPKGHGRILDEKEILNTEKHDGGWYDLVDLLDYIAGVSAIVEADTERK